MIIDVPTLRMTALLPSMVATDVSLDVYVMLLPVLFVVGAGIANVPTSNAREKLL